MPPTGRFANGVCAVGDHGHLAALDARPGRTSRAPGRPPRRSTRRGAISASRGVIITAIAHPSSDPADLDRAARRRWRPAERAELDVLGEQRRRPRRRAHRGGSRCRARATGSRSTGSSIAATSARSVTGAAASARPIAGVAGSSAPTGALAPDDPVGDRVDRHPRDQQRHRRGMLVHPCLDHRPRTSAR